MRSPAWTWPSAGSKRISSAPPEPTDALPAHRRDRTPWGILRRHPILALVAVAFLLRLASLTWGVKLGAHTEWFHPDESKAWTSVEGFPSIYLANRNFLYGTALQYTAGLVLYPLKFLWYTGHPLLPDLPYSRLVVLAVRAMHALLGALTVALLYVLARQLWDRTTATIAAALLAVSFYHVLNSSFTTLDVPMGFLVTLGILVAARADQSLALRDFAALGVVLGYAVGTKITGGALAVVPITLALSAPRGVRGRYVRGLALTALVAALVFAVSTPHVVLHPGLYLAAMRAQQFQWVGRFHHDPLSILQVRLSAMALTLTPPVAILALIGLVIGRSKPTARRLEWAVLAYLVLDVLVWRGYFPPRFLLPTVPILCGYAARPLALLLESTRPFRRHVGAALTAGALGLSLIAVLGGIWTRWQDPRVPAARAIAEIIPPGATLAIATMGRGDQWTTHRWRYPAVDTARVRVVPALDGPEFLIVTDWTLRPMDCALKSGRMGPDYVWPESLANAWQGYRPPTPDEFRLYADLISGRGSYAEIGRWDPVTALPVEFAGKSTRLYQRGQRPRSGMAAPTRPTLLEESIAWISPACKAPSMTGASTTSSFR